MSDITVSNDIHTFMQSASNSAARDNLGVGDSDAVNHASLTLTGNAEAVEFIGDLEGAVRFNAKAGEALTKGDAVYVSGISGNLPVVSKADSSSSSTMPSFGLAASTVSLNAAVQIVTFGTISEIDTSSYSLGDTLYVNGTGTLSATKPTGESNLVQNIGKVQRVHATSGSIKVGGAGRTNDTPNLDENKIFIGNSSNAASTAAISTVITDNSSSIKTAYESNSDTNAYTDAEKTKLSGIATGAEVNAVDSVNSQTGAVALDADDIDDTSTTHKFATAAQLTKIDGVESGAEVNTVDSVNTQTGAVVLDADDISDSTTTNKFTTASDISKLAGIETAADVTDATNVSAAGAPIISSGAGTPSSTPSKVGDIYIDTSSDDAYIAVGTASSSDWEKSNDGAGSGSTDLSWTASTSTVSSSTGTNATLTNADSSNAGLMSSSDKTKLDGIETGATADQDLSSYQLQPSEGAFANGDKTKLDGIAAGAEVNTVDSVNTQTGAVVLDADDISDAATTNKFTTAADISKLAGIETGADVTDTTNVTDAGALMDSEVTNLAQVKAFDSSDYATAAQGTTADSAMQNLSDDTTPSLGGPLDVAGQDIVTSSNGDIEIDPNGSGVTIFKGNATKGSGQFKLNCEANTHGITIKGPPHSANANYTLTLPDDDGSASQTLTTDGSGNLSWSTPSGSYGDSDVDTHLNTSSASTNQVLSWNGSDYAWVDQSGGGGTGGTSARIISIDAGALVPRTTNGAATATEEYATNDVMSDHFLFDGATEEGVQFRFHMPADWDGNAVNAKFYWDAATGASAADGVTWGIAMQAFQDNDALDNAFGTSVDTDDAVIAVGDLHVTALSSDITIAGSPAAGDMVIAEVTRVVGDANDTMTEDAKLVGVTIHYTATAALYDGQLGITIDGAGSVISTGSKGFLRAPFDCTITAAQILADQSGSIVIDVTKDTYANFPPTTLTDSICASALPTLSSSQKSEDTTLTGWTTSVSKGDVLGFVVNSATTVTRVSLNLVVTKT